MRVEGNWRNTDRNRVCVFLALGVKGELAVTSLSKHIHNTIRPSFPSRFKIGTYKWRTQTASSTLTHIHINKKWFRDLQIKTEDMHTHSWKADFLLHLKPFPSSKNQPSFSHLYKQSYYTCRLFGAGAKLQVKLIWLYGLSRIKTKVNKQWLQYYGILWLKSEPWVCLKYWVCSASLQWTSPAREHG